jgi:hypothetical protein
MTLHTVFIIIVLLVDERPRAPPTLPPRPTTTPGNHLSPTSRLDLETASGKESLSAGISAPLVIGHNAEVDDLSFQLCTIKLPDCAIGSLT